MIYIESCTSVLCGYCVSGKRLLRVKDVVFEEIKVSIRPQR